MAKVFQWRRTYRHGEQEFDQGLGMGPTGGRCPSCALWHSWSHISQFSPIIKPKQLDQKKKGQEVDT